MDVKKYTKWKPPQEFVSPVTYGRSSSTDRPKRTWSSAADEQQTTQSTCVSRCPSAPAWNEPVETIFRHELPGRKSHVADSQRIQRHDGKHNFLRGADDTDPIACRSNAEQSIGLFDLQNPNHLRFMRSHRPSDDSDEENPVFLRHGELQLHFKRNRFNVDHNIISSKASSGVSQPRSLSDETGALTTRGQRLSSNGRSSGSSFDPLVLWPNPSHSALRSESNWGPEMPRTVTVYREGEVVSPMVPAHRFESDWISDLENVVAGENSEQSNTCEDEVLMTIRTVKLRRRESGFGFVLAFERTKDVSEFERLPVIEAVTSGGAAEKSGILPGDRLLEINRRSVSGSSPSVCQSLIDNRDELILRVIQNDKKVRGKSSKERGTWSEIEALENDSTRLHFSKIDFAAVDSRKNPDEETATTSVKNRSQWINTGAGEEMDRPLTFTPCLKPKRSLSNSCWKEISTTKSSSYDGHFKKLPETPYRGGKLPKADPSIHHFSESIIKRKNWTENKNDHHRIPGLDKEQSDSKCHLNREVEGGESKLDDGHTKGLWNHITGKKDVGMKKMCEREYPKENSGDRHCQINEENQSEDRRVGLNTEMRNEKNLRISQKQEMKKYRVHSFEETTQNNRYIQENSFRRVISEDGSNLSNGSLESKNLLQDKHPVKTEYIIRKEIALRNNNEHHPSIDLKESHNGDFSSMQHNQKRNHSVHQPRETGKEKVEQRKKHKDTNVKSECILFEKQLPDSGRDTYESRSTEESGIGDGTTELGSFSAGVRSEGSRSDSSTPHKIHDLSAIFGHISNVKILNSDLKRNEFLQEVDSKTKEPVPEILQNSTTSAQLQTFQIPEVKLSNGVPLSDHTDDLVIVLLPPPGFTDDPNYSTTTKEVPAKKKKVPTATLR